MINFSGGSDETRAVVATTFKFAGQIISLPPAIDVEFNNLDRGWGLTSSRGTQYKIVLNANLSSQEAVLIMCHELIHLEQMWSGRLVGCSEGISWCGSTFTETQNLYYDEYMQLPWEIEANHRSEWLLAKILHMVQTQNLSKPEIDAPGSI